MEWNEIDKRLFALGKDRVWLADVTPYSWDTIRQALAPKGTARSHRMLSVLSRAIEDEEAKHNSATDLASVLEFEPDEWDQIVILATRAGQEPKDWIRAQILAYLAWCSTVKARGEIDPIGLPARLNPVYPITVLPQERVAESEEKERPL